MSELAANRSKQLVVIAWVVITAVLFFVFIFFLTPQAARVARTTLSLGFWAALFSVPVGFWFAWVQFRTRNFWTTWVLLIVISFLFVPLHLYVAAWDSAFGKLGFLRGTDGRAFEPLLAGFWAAVFVHFVAAIPWTTLIGAVCFRAIRRDVEDAAVLDASEVQVFFKVTLRKWAPLILLSVVWVMVMASREIAATDIYQVGTFAEEVYLQFAGGRFDWFGIDPAEGGSGRDYSLVGFILFCVWFFMSAVVCVLRFVPTKKLEWYSAPELKISRKKIVAIQLSVVVMFASLFLFPMINLLIRCGSRVPSVENPGLQFSWSHCVEQMLTAPRDYWVEISWSLTLGVLTAVVVVPVVMVLVTVSRRRPVLAIIMLLVTAISFSLPGPLIGAAINRLSLVFEFGWWDDLFNRTIAGPLLATVVVAFGPVYLLMNFLFRNVAKETLEAAEMDGGKKFWSRPVMGPLLVGVVAGSAICFLIGFTDLSASYIPTPPGMDTVPRRILGQMHAGVNDSTAALCLDCLVLVGTISLAATKIVSLNNARK